MFLESLLFGQSYPATTVDENGFFSGEKGITSFFPSKDEMEKAQAKDSDLREINLNDVQKSFDNKKSVVAIGISNVMLEKLLTDIAGVFFGENPWDTQSFNNSLLDASFDLIHEFLAHAAENVKTNKNEGNTFEDHKKF